jgi:hypothetical protein
MNWAMYESTILEVDSYNNCNQLYLHKFKLSKVILPVSIAERSKACTVYDRLNIEISGSNPARGVDVCLRVSVLCCPVFR